MEKPKDQDPGDARLVFATHNAHHARCGAPPRLRDTNNLSLYYGYFENRYGEQFVFTFDRATLTGTVSGGDLGWSEPKPDGPQASCSVPRTRDVRSAPQAESTMTAKHPTLAVHMYWVDKAARYRLAAGARRPRRSANPPAPD